MWNCHPLGKMVVSVTASLHLIAVGIKSCRGPLLWRGSESSRAILWRSLPLGGGGWIVHEFVSCTETRRNEKYLWPSCLSLFVFVSLILIVIVVLLYRSSVVFVSYCDWCCIVSTHVFPHSSVSYFPVLVPLSCLVFCSCSRRLFCFSFIYLFIFLFVWQVFCPVSRVGSCLVLPRDDVSGYILSGVLTSCYRGWSHPVLPCLLLNQLVAEFGPAPGDCLILYWFSPIGAVVSSVPKFV